MERRTEARDNLEKRLKAMISDEFDKYYAKTGANVISINISTWSARDDS